MDPPEGYSELIGRRPVPAGDGEPFVHSGIISRELNGLSLGSFLGYNVGKALQLLH